MKFFIIIFDYKYLSSEQFVKDEKYKIVKTHDLNFSIEEIKKEFLYEKGWVINFRNYEISEEFFNYLKFQLGK